MVIESLGRDKGLLTNRTNSVLCRVVVLPGRGSLERPVTPSAIVLHSDVLLQSLLVRTVRKFDMTPGASPRRENRHTDNIRHRPRDHETPITSWNTGVGGRLHMLDIISVSRKYRAHSGHRVSFLRCAFPAARCPYAAP